MLRIRLKTKRHIRKVVIGPCTLYHGDCLEVLPTLAAKSVSAVITDPPYGVGIAGWDYAMPPQEFLNECLRIAIGPIFWFGAASMILEFSRYDPRPDRLLMWVPKFTLSHTAKDGYAYRYHPLAVWRIEKQKTVAWDVLDDMTEGHRWWNHPATKPLNLIVKLCKTSSGDTILDPFMGSGTTGVACVQTGRKFIGIEIDKGYFEVAVQRIQRAVRDLKSTFFGTR